MNCQVFKSKFNEMEVNCNSSGCGFLLFSTSFLFDDFRNKTRVKLEIYKLETPRVSKASKLFGECFLNLYKLLASVSKCPENIGALKISSTF